MEEFEIKLKNARDKIFVADHMLTGTYSLLKDTKILLAILENINISFENIISAFLQYERLFRRIPSYTPQKDSEFNFFQLKVMDKFGFKKEYIETYDKIREILKIHKTSSVEFSRNDNLVIANNDYDLTKVSPEDIKKDIKTCKDFLLDVTEKINSLI